MSKYTHSSRRSGCSPVVRAALTGIVAAASIAFLGSAQADPQLGSATISPSRIVESLDALPQITSDQLVGNRTAKPYLSPVSAETLASLKAAAKSTRTAQQGPTFGAPSPETVGLEAVFSGGSNAACGAVTGFSVRPSDMGLAVGDTNVGVLQGINICLSVFDKTGVLQAGYPKATGTFFGLGAGINNSDPRMIYDWINHRYYFVIISYPNSCGTACTTAAFYNLAVSSADSPTGAWCLYTVPVATTPNPDGNGVYLLPDFPRLGQDRDAIYLASNLFRGNNYVGEEIRALQKSTLQTCSNTLITSVTGLTTGFTIQPANVFSPADQPKSMFFITSFCCGSSNQLVVSSFHQPFPFNASTTFNQITISAANTYATPPDATQQGTATLIATNDERISGSAYYAAGSIYGALTTDGGNTEPGIIMYQVQPFVDTSGVAGTDGKITSARILSETKHYGTGTNAFYYPAQQPDGEGNVLTVFGFSSSANYASAGYAMRRASQTPGTWPDNGLTAQAGLGTYATSNPQRWGDYFATAPAGIVSGGGTGANAKFWFAAQRAVGGNNWGTTIGRAGYTAISQD